MKFLNWFAKKTVTFSVVAAMLLSVFTVQAAHFTDTADHWAGEVIEKWSQYQILSGFGDGTVRPNDPITKAQLSVILNKFMKHTLAEKEYADVAWGEWYYNDMMALKDKDIFYTGVDNNAYPNSYMTRQEAIAAIARAFDVTSDTKVTSFKDDAQISISAKPFIAAMQDKGYVVGDGSGYFLPTNYFTRAEIFTIINKVVGNYVNEAKTYNDLEKGNALVNLSGAILKDTVVTGDLYITPGVKNGDVTLDNVTVIGRTIVQGGGENSIHLKNGTTLTGSVVIKNTDRKVRIAADSTSSVEGDVQVSTGAILDGNYKNVTVMGKDIGLEVRGKVESISINAVDASIVITKDASVNTIIAKAANALISGAGEIKKVEVKADDVHITTGKTQIVVDSGVTGTKAGDTDVKAGTTTTTNASGTGSTQTPTGGGGGGSSSDNSDSGSSSGGEQPQQYVTVYYKARAVGGQVSVNVVGYSNATKFRVVTNEDVSEIVNIGERAAIMYLEVGEVVSIELYAADGTTKVGTVNQVVLVSAN